MKVCDKCGKAIKNDNGITNVKFPYYIIRIRKMNNLCGIWEDVDLCGSCEQEVIDFIKKGIEKDE